MKKFKNLLCLVIIASLGLVGCAGKASNNEVIIGASPLPHAQILEIIKDDLKNDGINLVIREISDYNIPNEATATKELDANFFQHQPYLDTFNENSKEKLVSISSVHLEPMGAYSKRIKSIDDIKFEDKIAIPNDPSNEGRALLLLEKKGIIKLKSSTKLNQTPKDILKNPKNLEFKELEASQLPRVLNDVDLAIINTNVALDGGLNPKEDAIFLEDKESPYANILVVREDNKDNENLKKVVKHLNSDKVRNFINNEYKGEILPTF